MSQFSKSPDDAEEQLKRGCGAKFLIEFCVCDFFIFLSLSKTYVI